METPDRFQMSPVTRGLLDTMSTSRKFGACSYTLMRIGQYCIDVRQDGWITEAQLRSLREASTWRTMQGYIALLVDCGALERRDDDTYIVANFLETNYSAAQLKARQSRSRQRERRAEPGRYRRRQQL